MDELEADLARAIHRTRLRGGGFLQNETGQGEPTRPAARLTLGDLRRAWNVIRRSPRIPRQPVFCGDSYELAKGALEQGLTIICSSRVRTLLGEHYDPKE